MSKQLYAIKDSQGRYVDKFSIRYNSEDQQYKYISKAGWEFDNRNFNTDTGVILSKSLDEARATVQLLQSKLSKVNRQSEVFTITLCDSESPLGSIYAVYTNRGYISSSMIVFDEETGWKCWFHQKPRNMHLCYESQVNEEIADIKRKMGYVGLDLELIVEQIQ